MAKHGVYKQGNGYIAWWINSKDGREYLSHEFRSKKEALEYLKYRGIK